MLSYSMIIREVFISGLCLSEKNGNNSKLSSMGKIYLYYLGKYGGSSSLSLFLWFPKYAWQNIILTNEKNWEIR